MSQNRMTFAVLFGNRGFFAESLIAGARRDMETALDQAGYNMLTLPAAETAFGAVESAAEGAKFANFLAQHRGQYDGAIVCLANFGDETGAIAALQDCGVPILIQAYPDELDKMAMSDRRDAFCGKFSVMDVFYQYGLPFTVLPPHTVHPASAVFADQLAEFAAVCRVVKALRRATIGAIGARTTAFKTVRFDELALQRHGLTTETYDLSEVISRARSIDTASAAFREKAHRLKHYTSWGDAPDAAFENLSRLGVVLDEIVEEAQLDAIALRCWIELEKELHIAPCVLLSEMNDRGIPAACELDVCNAIPMLGLTAASSQAATCLDWNNNYGDDPDKCILFHCGPVPQSLMTAKGEIVDHPMFAKALGAGCGWGCNTGRITPTPFTYASSKTQDGKLHFYLGEGTFTDDPIPESFFGCAGVACIADLQDRLLHIGKNGYRHHVSVTPSRVERALREAFTTYLGYQVDL